MSPPRRAPPRGSVTYVKQDRRPDVAPNDFKMNALVAVLARNPKDLGDLVGNPDWHLVKPDPRVPAWTDDYSNILAVRKKLGQ